MMKKLILFFLLLISFSVCAEPKAGYSVAEITFKDKAGYENELFPKIKKLISEGGGVIIVAGGQSQGIFEAHRRVDSITIVRFESYEKAKAFYASSSYQDVKRTAEKYIDISLYIVEGE
jgi:hypothetical protein